MTSTFPSFLAIDMTDLLAKYQAGKTSFYLTLGSTTTAARSEENRARISSACIAQCPQLIMLNWVLAFCTVPRSSWRIRRSRSPISAASAR